MMTFHFTLQLPRTKYNRKRQNLASLRRCGFNQTNGGVRDMALFEAIGWEALNFVETTLTTKKRKC